MTTDALDQTLNTIRNIDEVRRITMNDDGDRIVACASVDYEDGMAGHFTNATSAMFRRIETALAAHGFAHWDSEVDDIELDGRGAVEVWTFAR